MTSGVVWNVEGALARATLAAPLLSADLAIRSTLSLYRLHRRHERSGSGRRSATARPQLVRDASRRWARHMSDSAVPPRNHGFRIHDYSRHECMSHDFHYDEKTEIMEAMNSWVKSMISYCDPIADVALRVTLSWRLARNAPRPAPGATFVKLTDRHP